MKKNKIFIIILTIFFILALGSAVLAYLYMETDFLKGNQELFAKYFTQEIDTFQDMMDFETVESYKELKNQNKYESNINIKLIHSEGGEISNPFNNLSAKLDIQKDGEQQYFYANGQILYKEEQIVDEKTVTEDKEYLQAEIIKENEQYGIRFTDAVKQFVTIKKDENIENIANEIGIDTKQLEKIINVIDGTEDIISENDINESKNKYLNIIKDEISKGTFERQKNAMITYNGNSIKTNAYSVSLNSEQVKNVLANISSDIEEINNFTKDLEIPTVKITVYEQNEITIRTVIEIGQNRIIIENLKQSGQIKTKISYSDLSIEQENEYEFEIIKTNAENQEKFEVFVTIVQGEDESNISIISETKLDNNILLDLKISYEQDIKTMSIVLENQVNIGNSFEKTQSLEVGNYVSLSDIEDESRRKQLIDLLKEIVPQKTLEKVGLLKEKLDIKDEETENLEVESENGAIIPET